MVRMAGKLSIEPRKGFCRLDNLDRNDKYILKENSMKKIVGFALVAVLSVSCGNSNSSEEGKDTANVLVDTLPAGSTGLAPDSNAADNTAVDTLNYRE